MLDLDAYTPSDFCIMGHNMTFNDYHPASIERDIRYVFKRKYGFENDEIVYVNPCYKIRGMMKLQEDLEELI